MEQERQEGQLDDGETLGGKRLPYRFLITALIFIGKCVFFHELNVHLIVLLYLI